MKRSVMLLAWQFFKQTRQNFAECLRKAWANIKLQRKMQTDVVRFRFQKIDGTITERWGTLRADLLPKTSGSDRKKNDTVQVFFDNEKQEFRCFKKFNIVI